MKKITSLILGMLVCGSTTLALEWSTCVEYITRDDPAAKWLLQDDGQGVYIKLWQSTVSKPTKADLEAIEATAIAWKREKTNTTDAEYQAWTKRERALCRLFVKEINKLRAHAGLSQYKEAQVKAALKAEMDQMKQ